MPSKPVPPVEIVPLASLAPQAQNPNLHSPASLGALERSIQRDGLIDAGTLAADGSMISGSARLEVGAAINLHEAIIVDSTGDKPIYIRRTDIATNTTPQARRLSVLANSVPAQNWVPDVPLLADWAGDDPLLASDMDADYRMAALLNVNRLQQHMGGLDDQHEADEWIGMPEYDTGTGPLTLILSFRTAEDRAELARVLGLRLTDKTKSAWWPPKPMQDLASVRFEDT